MPALLVLAFVVVPLVELVVITQVWGWLGGPWTIAILLVDSLLGAYLLKRESRRAWHDFRAALSTGRWPGDEVTQGGLVIVGGTLLLTPGFVTDVVGLLALLPPSRAVLVRFIRRRVVPGALFGTTSDRAGRHRGGQDDLHTGPRTLDVAVVEVQREPPSQPPDGT